MRLPFPSLSPGPVGNLRAIKTQLEEGPLGHALAELIWTRVSQMNGCHYCVSMHSKSMLAAGDSTARLEALADWEKSALFTERERAALTFAEAVTNIQAAGVPDSVYLPLKGHFDDRTIVDLTVAIALINAFNRLSIAMGARAPTAGAAFTALWRDRAAGPPRSARRPCPKRARAHRESSATRSRRSRRAPCPHRSSG